MPETQPNQNERIGSDNRPHHKWGFSFVSTIEKCPAAERATSTSKSLEDAAERGTDLHELLELSVKHWMEVIGKSPSMTFERVVAAKAAQLNTYDMKSVMKIVDEIKVNFVADPNLLVGTEELIELKHPVTGDVLSYGYYDIILILGNRALIIDHKFVRKEVDEAEKNRQGHCLVVAALQTYPQVEYVEILFTMPECQSSRHEFTRADDFERLQNELVEIFEAADRPAKTLRCGEHCAYCRHSYHCTAALDSLGTMAMQIVPMAVPDHFDPAKIFDPKQMALVRYWVSALEPVIEQIKKAANELALSGQSIETTINGEHVSYRIQTRKGSLKIKDSFELYNATSGWLPVEAFIKASRISLSELRSIATQILSAQVLEEGKKPNMREISDGFDKWLVDNQLVDEGAPSSFLTRSKAGKKKALKTAEAVTEEIHESDEKVLEGAE